MSTCTHRTVVADASGKLWDLGNPNFIAIGTSDSGLTTDIQNFSGTVFTGVTISFADACAAFAAS